MPIKEKLKSAVPDHKQPSTMVGFVAMALAYAKFKDSSVDWDACYNSLVILWHNLPAFYALIGGLGVWKFFSKD